MAALDDGIELTGWDKAFSAPARFAIAVALEATSVIDFTELRKALGISATLMSKHVSVLEDAGYVEISKVVFRRRVKTELRVTNAGHVALENHRAFLERVAAFGSSREKI